MKPLGKEKLNNLPVVQRYLVGIFPHDSTNLGTYTKTFRISIVRRHNQLK